MNTKKLIKKNQMDFIDCDAVCLFPFSLWYLIVIIFVSLNCITETLNFVIMKTDWTSSAVRFELLMKLYCTCTRVCVCIYIICVIVCCSSFISGSWCCIHLWCWWKWSSFRLLRNGSSFCTSSRSRWRRYERFVCVQMFEQKCVIILSNICYNPTSFSWVFKPAVWWLTRCSQTWGSHMWLLCTSVYFSSLDVHVWRRENQSED